MTEPVRYVSTRGGAPELTFGDVLLTGLAADGGLYVPSTWPSLPNDWHRGGPYADVATKVMWPFVAGSIDESDFAAIVADAYSTFDHPDVCPLRDLGDGLSLLELFWGPTLAFKDVALQLVGRLFDHELAKRGERVTIVGATSGDTGAAAIEALRDRDAVDVFILHPAGRVSEIQRHQMTTVDAANVHNIAIDGTFDDCQDLVKAMFADEPFRNRLKLSAVNSINWARVMAQIVYYVTAAAAVTGPDGPVSFSVPTGNFGNVFAGHVARRMGLPIDQLVIGTNRNDILTRLFDSGTMEMQGVNPTTSPSMDIQVSSNLERLLFELHGSDGEAIAELMGRFRDEGTVTLDAQLFAGLGESWAAARYDDAQVTAIIADEHDRSAYVLDTHSAIGVAAARDRRRSMTTPMVALATAHPAKFPDAVEAATGVRPALPDRLADLLDRPERLVDMPNDLAAVESYVASNARVG